jgi:hypothetical protein
MHRVWFDSNGARRRTKQLGLRLSRRIEKGPDLIPLEGAFDTQCLFARASKTNVNNQSNVVAMGTNITPRPKVA